MPATAVRKVAFNPHLQHVLAKSLNPLTTDDYQKALSSMDAFLAEMGKSIGTPFAPENSLESLLALQKATFSQSGSAVSGLTYYDLELGAKFLYPVLTPLRNEIPRVSGKGGIQAAWRAVTAINTTGMRIGVSAGNRGGVQSVTTTDYTAAYKGIGLETNVDFEAQYAGMGFDDIRAIAAKTGLESTMIGEELLLLGGNTSVLLGTAANPTLADVSTGGTLVFSTQYSVIVAALSLDAVVNGSVAGGVQGPITRLNADGSSDNFGGGVGKLSNAVQITTAADALSTHSITASVTAVQGACGYAWFMGPIGNERLTSITTINSAVLTTLQGATQTAASLGAADNSTNSLVFDGLLYQALKSGSNAYVKIMANGVAGTGTPLTGDGAGGIVEIDALLKDRWDLYRLSPDTMWVSSQEAQNISKKILTGTSTSAQRFVFESVQSAVGGGIMVTTYLNKFSMQGAKVINIRIHPNMPAGTILFTTKALPYPLSGVGNIIQVRTRQDYYQIEWPLRTRKYESGVYADEVLQNYFPPSMGVITNIGNG